MCAVSKVSKVTSCLSLTEQRWGARQWHMSGHRLSCALIGQIPVCRAVIGQRGGLTICYQWPSNGTGATLPGPGQAHTGPLRTLTEILRETETGSDLRSDLWSRHFFTEKRHQGKGGDSAALNAPYLWPWLWLCSKPIMTSESELSYNLVADRVSHA